MHIDGGQIHQRDVEGTYRLLLTSSPVDKGRVDVTYSYSIPVFVSAFQPNNSSSLSLTAPAPGEIELQLMNNGNVHQFAESVHVTGFDRNGVQAFSAEQVGWYLLPNGRCNYTLHPSRNNCAATVRIVSKIQFRDRPELDRADNLRMACDGNISETSFAPVDSQIQATPMLQR